MIRTSVAILSLALLAIAFLRIEAQGGGLATLRVHVGDTPVTLRFRPDAPPAPAVVIAHGFAGSQGLMAPFATTLARAGYVAVSYDMLGHGRHPAPLAGDVTRADGATAALLAQIAEVATFARAQPQSDGRLALLGHSMASDIVVRAARATEQEARTARATEQEARTARATETEARAAREAETEARASEDGERGETIDEDAATAPAGEPSTAADAATAPAVAATVAVSLFSPEVTADSPRNLLVITGAWEAGLTGEALRVAGLAAGAPAEPFVTVGDPAAGTARRAVLAPRVEHVGVLYSPVALAEARDWLNLVFARGNPTDAPPDARGGWLGIWLVGVLGLAWGLAPRLPRLAPERPRVTPRRAAFFAALAVPALAAPLIATRLPQGLLPAPVADYLAAHFLVWGLAGLLMLRLGGWPALAPPPPLRLAAATAALVAFALVALYWPVDRFVTTFAPQPTRMALLATLVLGMLPYFLADEVLTRASAAPLGAYALAKLAFLASLAFAIALDPSRLFFLILILPVMVIFFTLLGLISRWSFDATGSPLPAALANAALFAWAIAVTFPMLGR